MGKKTEGILCILGQDKFQIDRILAFGKKVKSLKVLEETMGKTFEALERGSLYDYDAK